MNPTLQSESAECGLACLAMVASHHGHRADLRELRQRFPLSLKGANLARLIDVAGKLGFASRPLRLDLEDLPKLKTPCILHWNLNHFVVLAKADKTRVTILDPAIGKLTLRKRDVMRPNRQPARSAQSMPKHVPRVCRRIANARVGKFLQGAS